MPLYISVLSLVFVLNFLGFFLAYFFRTDKLTDISYSLSFACAIIFIALKIDNISIHFLVTSILILIWATRLGAFLLNRILRMGRDKRFDSMRNSFFRFGGFWLLQAFTVSLILLPLPLIANSQNSGFDIFLIIGTVISISGLLIESLSDYQKSKFKKKYPDSLFTKGLFTYVKYPNFLGEIMFWFGIWINGLGSYFGWEFLTIISPIYVLILLRFISGIPIIEKKRNEIYNLSSENQIYADKTPLLIPFNLKKLNV